MAKRIQVGGRIESNEVGGIVTGAAEILDDAKGKKQSVINGETDDELARLDHSKQNNLTFDNAPTEGSDNPVKSGGVYAADKALSDAIEAILLLIPSAASALNKLVDTAMMNSSISTATATFKGTYNVITDLSLTIDATHGQIAAALGNAISTADNNDYAFVQIPVSAESTDIRRTERYKYNGTAWGYEYDLNISGFTAAQWAAINSGITIALVGKLIGLPTSSELQALLGQKQNTLTFDNVPTAGSDNPVKSGGVYSAINDEKTAREQLGQTVTGIDGRVENVEEVIPTGAAANNKLVANNSMEAYVTSIIEAITASFTIATADGHINLTLTQTNGRVASLTLTSSDIASAQALTALTGRVSTAESDITTLGGRVSTNETDIANLQQLYNDLQQSKPVPVTELPETGQQQGVIYRLAGSSSYSDYMWNGSTWVLMATYNNAIDPRPKKASLNLVTSGGVFDNMGALDVSELNATENPHTLAQYVDLSAALAAIPTDYQKGGMSIKFVQSSDNNYIQARLMANAFTTDISQWQVVDDEPFCDSKNLLISNGTGNIVGAFKIKKTIRTSSSIVGFATLQVDNAPIELWIKVITNTAEYEQANNWLGIQINGDNTPLADDGTGIFYFKNSNPDTLNYTTFVLYTRKCITAGEVELLVNTNNGKATLIQSINNEKTRAEAKELNLSEAINVEKQRIDTISDVLPLVDDGWERQEGGVYELRNFTSNNGTRLLSGYIYAASSSLALITDFIPIQADKRYKLKTLIADNFDGVAYYSGNTGSHAEYLGNDDFHTIDDNTIKEAILNIPANATYMRFGTKDYTTAYEVYVADKEFDIVASEDYVNNKIEEGTAPLEEDIDTLYGIVSQADTPPELAVKYVPTIKLYLGNNVLNISSVTYDSNFWTVENGLPKYIGGTGGGREKTFKFNASTIEDARYLCDIVTLTQDNHYGNLFYLRIGDGPLVDTYNGSRTTFGGFLSDGGEFEIVPYGTKAFDVTSISLKPLVSSETEPDYTETRNLSVDNVNCGNSARTLIDGKWNVAVGPTGNTMANNINGSRSIAIGLSALKNWKYGMQNVAIGTFAMSLLEEGNHNIAIGSDCLWQVKKAQDNVVIGRSAMCAEGVDGELANNVVIGYFAMGNNKADSNNSVTIGYKANMYGAKDSVFIGSDCTTTEENRNISNVIAVGKGVRATNSNQAIIGNTSVTEFILGSKKLIFNQDGTVSWEAVS